MVDVGAKPSSHRIAVASGRILMQPATLRMIAAGKAKKGDVLGVAEYGEPFASVVARDPLFGVQFHPEKSSVHGLRLLENFAAICARVAA